VCQLPWCCFSPPASCRFVEDAGHGFSLRWLQTKRYEKLRPALTARRDDYVMSRAATVQAPIAAVPTCAARDELTVRALRTATGARAAAVPAAPTLPSTRTRSRALALPAGRKRGLCAPGHPARHRSRSTALWGVPIERDPFPGSASLDGAAGRLWVESVRFRQHVAGCPAPRFRATGRGFVG
jgi:hypothetical protein